jgi:hypothetical protein
MERTSSRGKIIIIISRLTSEIKPLYLGQVLKVLCRGEKERQDETQFTTKTMVS